MRLKDWGAALGDKDSEDDEEFLVRGSWLKRCREDLYVDFIKIPYENEWFNLYEPSKPWYTFDFSSLELSPPSFMHLLSQHSTEKPGQSRDRILSIGQVWASTALPHGSHVKR